MNVRLPFSIFFVLFFLFLRSGFSQTLQLWEDQFESTQGFGEVPAGYTGDFKVYLNHGEGPSKGLCAQHFSFNLKDSIISPAIGPLPPQSSFSFSYRLVETYTGSTPTFAFEPQASAEAIEFFVAPQGASDFGTPLFTINQSNHTASLGFVSRSIDLSAFSGNTIQLKIRSLNPQGRDYWVDLDQFVVEYTENPNAQVEHKAKSREWSVYPNPASSKAMVQLAEPLAGGKIQLINMLGAVVKEFRAQGARIELNVEDLPRGIYYVKIDDATKNQLRKLILH